MFTENTLKTTESSRRSVMVLMFLSLFFPLFLSSATPAETGKLSCPAGAKEIQGISEDGNVVYFCERRGKKNGPYLEPSASGTPKVKAEYKDDILHGPYICFFENGQKQTEGVFEQGKFNGQWNRWYPNGKPVDSGVWRDNQPEGEWTQWFENGKLKAKGSYMNGCREGKWVFYFENGKERKSGNYSCDREIGFWSERDSPHEITIQKDYSRDEEYRKFRPLHLQINEIMGFQSPDGQVFSLQASWNPYYTFSDRFSLKGNLGLTAFRSMLTDSLFPAIELGVLASYTNQKLPRLRLQFGPGVQTWLGDNGGMAPVIFTETHWRFEKRKFRVIQSLFLGYSAFFFGPGFVHQVKLGIGVRI